VERVVETIVPEHKPSRAPVIDMMEALKRSLRNAKAQKGKETTAPGPAGREHHRRLAG
jgi:non-homologous end joining protein Ku